MNVTIGQLTSETGETKIFKVDTEDGIGGWNSLGYAKGTEEDIRKFFEPKKLNDLYLTELQVREVTEEQANIARELITEKTILQNRIKEINELLSV